MSKSVPKLRFDGFDDEWEDEKLDNLGNTFTGLSGKTKEDFGHGEAQFVPYVNVYKNPITDLAFLEKVEIDSRQNSVTRGDIFFTTSSETPEEVGLSSIWLGNSTNTYLNSFCFGFRPDKNLDSYYMAFLLRSPSIRSKIKLLAQGISRYNISKTKMMEIMIPIPLKSEQEKIGSFFKTLDQLISLQEKKIALLKEQKKGFLQKLFPKAGAKVPEMRFAEFEGNWKEHKLNNITSKIGSGKTPMGGNKVYKNTGIPLLRSQNIYNDRVYFEDTVFISTAVDNEMANSRVHIGDVLLNITGASIGRSAVYSKKYHSNVNQHVCVIRPTLDFDSNFIQLYLTSAIGKMQIDMNQAGGGREGLNFKQIGNFIFSYPSKDEQEIISYFFKKIDDVIILSKTSLENMKKQKKGLLQMMFI